jgi:hypothetical protein
MSCSFYSSVSAIVIHESPCGYFTDIPAARGDSITDPVSIINFPPETLTINLSKFLGAGPA